MSTLFAKYDSEELQKEFLQKKRIPYGSERDPFIDHSELFEEIANKTCKGHKKDPSYKCDDFEESDVETFLFHFLFGKTEEERTDAIIQHLQTNCKKDDNGKRTYNLMGKKICRTRFVQLIKSSTHKLSTCENKITGTAPESSHSTGIRELKKDEIINFFESLKIDLKNIEMDPSRKAKFVIPCDKTTKQDVYEDYTEWMKENGDVKLISANKYFFKIWKSDFKDIILQTGGFMKFLLFLSFFFAFDANLIFPIRFYRKRNPKKPFFFNFFNSKFIFSILIYFFLFLFVYLNYLF